MTPQEKGGQATLKKYGRDHYREIGRKGGLKTAQKEEGKFLARIASIGGRATAEKFHREPLGTNDFLIVHKATGHVCARTLNGQPTPRCILEQRGEYTNGHKE